jgi:DNA/RNA endonuclease YhcR with UshA esterase domain
MRVPLAAMACLLSLGPAATAVPSRPPLERALLTSSGIGFENEEVQGMLIAVTMEKATIQNKEGTLTVLITERTDVRMGVREASAADLRPGMMVHVTYVRQLQRRLATVIVVDPPVAIGNR